LRSAALERFGQATLGKGAALGQAVPFPDADRLAQRRAARFEVGSREARLELGEAAQGDAEVVQRGAAGDLALWRAPSSSAAGGSPRYSACTDCQGFGGLETGRVIPPEYRVGRQNGGLMRKVICGAALVLAAAAVGAQPKLTPTPGHHERKADDVFRLKPLSGGVYALYGRGGNVGFFVGPEAVVVVDSQFKDIAPGIVKQIRSVTDRPIQYLVNTHHHGDHTGGNEVFRQFAVIIAQDNVRKRMLASPADILQYYPGYLEEAKKKNDAEDIRSLENAIAWAKKVRVEEIAAPVLTFDSELRIHAGDETIGIWHTPPAHTDGDSVVYFEKANVLHMGDLFFHKFIPFIDVKHGGSVKGYLQAIDGVIARVPANVVIIPGHGEVTDLAGLKAFRQFIADVLAAAEAAKAAGKSKEQFLAGVNLPAYKDYEGYADRFQETCGAAYEEAAGR
jgi:glyoxylase-like metal-dependent hydrolase (beta-lactamase superfamily II)